MGVQRVELAGHPDGGLGDIPSYRLTAQVTRLIGEGRPSHLLVFDTGGVTGRRDHQRATEAALLAIRRAGISVLGWTLPQELADRLNAEFGTSFTGRGPAECRVVEPVSRQRQRRAIAFPQSRLRSTGRDPHRQPVVGQSGALAPSGTPRQPRIPADPGVTCPSPKSE
ncbi:PIG-L deacetylase family protein [Streptomyces sp. NBC_01615]|uniref:PIG-L deacetylase family protein n=1 Tax=Streptomyces sp. NBC_01615 TaxID=2975898 RepID=UPI00386B6222